MITKVVISKRAQKDLLRVPRRIVEKFQKWLNLLEINGLENTMKIPGTHDEPLKGKRSGQRSIRLSRSYRAIYKIMTDDMIEFIRIEEVTKHAYKK